MLLKVFSIRDEKGKCFGQPFFMAHNGMALRAFSDLIQDNKTTVNHHPEDFKLYLLGEFDDNSGGLSDVPQPEFLAHATDFVVDKKV